MDIKHNKSFKYKKNINIDFIFSFNIDLIRGSATFPWIGLSYKISSYSWIWSDGTPDTYSNWYTGEPSDKDNQCVAVSKIIYLFIFFNTFSIL